MKVCPKRRGATLSFYLRDTAYRKGNRLIFRYREVDVVSGNANELGDASGTPGKSYLFFLTAFNKKREGRRRGGNSSSCLFLSISLP
jgi:hypothetical protein